jgi:pyrimidine operon attenuation protein/uracil phosphoribosyltransferase
MPVESLSGGLQIDGVRLIRLMMPVALPPPQIILDAGAMAASLGRMAGAIHDRQPGEAVHFVGIETRGVFLARRVAGILESRLGPIPCGSLDISLYRDDLDGLPKVPELRGSSIPFDVDGARIVLFDDVIYTGRTIRAALEELMDFGRPERIELAVFLDRGHRELPIQPDYCAHRHQTEPDEYIRVRLHELDGEDAVILAKKGTAT